MGKKLKAILLIPAAFAGAFTVLAFDIPPRTTADAELDPRHRVFVDESGVNTAMTRTYGRVSGSVHQGGS